ncbi:hypothetical protein [Paenibacillus tengchongensis]|uniref:hypothetical protein n=1 Tax=Paenibacillus tengchongensis TaxID=2608684 RepID=UPI00124C0FF7|nr:hypothetical protein [Paenibacillus tengchongensis]
MYKVGIIGPAGSVERIGGLANIFEPEIAFRPFVYVQPRETVDIIRRHDKEVDSWLCSGPIPYSFACKALGSADRVEYVWVTESGFYKSLLDLAFTRGGLPRRISIDMPENEGFIEHALKLIENAGIELYTRIYELDADPEELLGFHEDLWQEGRTDGAITCFPNVAAGLKDKGVPAYTVSPSNLEIIQSLRLFAEKVRTSYFKDTQIGIEIIELENYDRIAEKLPTSYQLQHLELDIKKELIQLSEKLDGTLMEQGGGRYILFSTRGAIERELALLGDTVDYLAATTGSGVAVGVGYGVTVFSAETNAHRALRQSKEKTGRRIVIVQEDGVIVESAGQEEETLAYSFRTDDQEVAGKLRSSGISVKTFNKVVALVRKMGWEHFTAKDVAAQLQMTERNARRIMTELADAGLAECVGEEAPGVRGRPSKIYRFS